LSSGPRLLEDPRALEFLPALQRLEEAPPSPLGRKVLWTLLALLSGTLLWAALGRLDIVAVAEGKLVPSTYVKIVQPAEQGIVKELLVTEGEVVRAGQVLVRMDPSFSEADRRSTASEYHTKRIALRRIDAELSGRALTRSGNDPAATYAQAEAQYEANVRAYRNAIAQEQAVLEKSRQDLAAALEVKAKLVQTLPIYREQEKAF
jgi:HlyD family secretion protein